MTRTTTRPDPFAVLGVDPARLGDDQAAWQQLRRAYRLRAKATHPDHGGSDSAFRQVQHAWEQVTDTDWRRLRDQVLEARRSVNVGKAVDPPTAGAPSNVTGTHGADRSPPPPAAEPKAPSRAPRPSILGRLLRVLLWTQKLAIGATLALHGAILALFILLMLAVGVLALPYVLVVLLLAGLDGNKDRGEMLAELSPGPVLGEAVAWMPETMLGLWGIATLWLSGPVAAMTLLWLFALGVRHMVRGLRTWYQNRCPRRAPTAMPTR